jgi:arylsulfatase A-like enzyme
MTGRDARLLQPPANSIVLRRTDRTIAHVLRDSGYTTALFGKFGIGSRFGENDPMAMGFTRWRGVLHNIEAHRQYPTMMYDDNEVVFIAPNVGGAKGAYAQRLFTDAALSFLDGQNGSRPFFAFLSYTSPHAELAAPEEFIAPYRGKFKETRYPGWTGDPKAPGFPAYYPEAVEDPNAVTAGMITALDQYVGEIMAKLDEKGLAQNTIIFFSSDNGAHLEGGADPVVTRASSPFRGTKRDLTDGGIHVPLIVRWPSRIAAGGTNDTPVYFADILPTLIDIVGPPRDALEGANFNGVSIADLMTDRDGAIEDRTLYWAFGQEIGDPNAGVIGDLTQAARRGQWKALRSGPNAPVQLYDIVKDRDESDDLASKRRKLAAEFRDFFDAELKK